MRRDDSLNQKKTPMKEPASIDIGMQREEQQRGGGE
jgi:hypothetical protein